MVLRTLYAKFDDAHATPHDRARVVAAGREILTALPGLVSLEVGTAAEDGSGRSWDLAFLLRFSSLDYVAPAEAHPVYTDFVDAHLAPRGAFLKRWTFRLA